MRVSEDNDHFMHCHSVTSCITTSFIREYLTHKRGSREHKREWARTENQRGVLHCCLLSQLLAPFNNIELTSASHCHFLSLSFSLQTPFVSGAWHAMPWYVVKSISMKKSQGNNFTFIAFLWFHQLDISSMFDCQRKRVCAYLSAPMGVCVCVHVMMVPSHKYLGFISCLKSRSHRCYI